jgi:hypothetical protein
MNVSKSCSVLLTTAVLPLAVSTALAQTITGPSSSQSPYVVPSQPGVLIKSIMTVGDSVNLKPDGVTPYRAVGIMDGLGVYDNFNGTFTVLMNHEIPVNNGVPLGIARAHGNAGAFVSRWTIRRGDFKVLKVEDLVPNATSIFLSNNDPDADVAHTGFLSGASTIFARLCSADLASPGAYAWFDWGTFQLYGTVAPLFQTGEESGGIINAPSNGPPERIHFGRQFALVATDDPFIAGNQARAAYEMPHHGLFAWENNLASPHSQRKTIVMGMDDGSPIGQVYVWVGDKQTTGNVVERAGLVKLSANDNLYVVRVPSLTTVDGAGVPIEDRAQPVSGPKGTAVPFVLVNEGDVSALTFDELEALSDTNGAAQFLRPEDGAWDPENPSDFYFVTTDRYDEFKDNIDGTDPDTVIDEVGRTRLYRLRFTDIFNPELGGTIEAMLDGTEAGNMFDNMTMDRHGQILIQEDVGNQQHSSKIWLYDVNDATLTEVAKHDSARFGDLGVPATAPYNQDEESSGIIDASHVLGRGWYLLDVQAHYNPGVPELVEGGQLLVMHVPPRKQKGD